ncbi:hypothetical protein HQ524_01415 [Candidatus Uhrbacteria bacterium]|nr:hypothetical protein [Candidatus Uhrbacteria bacterium]
MNHEQGHQEGAEDFVAPSSMEAQEQPEAPQEASPDMWDSGGDWGGEDLQGIDFGVYFPPKGGEVYSFKFDPSATANPELAGAIREVLDEKKGNEILADIDGREDGYSYQGDPRQWLRETVVPEAQSRLESGSEEAK